MASALVIALVAVGSLIAGGFGVKALEGLDQPFVARVESQEPDGSWKTVAEPVEWGQAGPIHQSDRHPRVVVHNQRLTPADATIDITFYNDRTFQVVRQEWHLKPLETRRLAFTVPDSAFYPPDFRGAPNEGVLTYVNVDDLRMSVSVGRA